MTNLDKENPKITDTYNIDESFPVLMMTCVKYMREALNARIVAKGYSVTSEQWMLLALLADQDGVSQLELAKRTDKTEVSTLNLLKKLEAGEFVVRKKDPVDGRSRRVYLTRKGRDLQAELTPIAKSNIEKMSEGISAENIEMLKQMLRKITKNLKV